ncbi:MAG: hypothetical protein ACTSVP_06280 [Candidatus Heimdallarchaeota archaeon]
MLNKIQTELLGIITRKSNIYPVTIKGLVKELGYSNGLIHRHVTKLKDWKLLDAKKVARKKGGVTFYKIPEAEWPKYLGKKCFDCHNKNMKSYCTFNEELAELGFIVNSYQHGVKLTKNTYACDKDFILRKRNWYKTPLEKFQEKNRQITETEDGLKISYHCANEECKAELPVLGSEFIAKLGSSVVRCDECNSFYKSIYDTKRKIFIVHYNIEKGKEYKRNFLRVTKEIEPEGLYSSDKHGIVINDLRDCELNFRTRTLIVNNFVGKFRDVKYIVVKRKEDSDYLEEILPAKGYHDIEIILVDDELVSPPPIKQHIGLLKLLRKLNIVSKEFCVPMLENRIMIIIQTHELFGKEEEIRVRKAIKTIEEIIDLVKAKPWITSKEWNYFEMRAGKEMWGVISVYLGKLGIAFPGRVKCRKVVDPSLPHRKFYSYSQIDTLINGIFGISGIFVKEYCNEINFCWDGYPGLNHGKTKGGILGFHLDLREPEKILPILNLLKAIIDDRINPKEVLYFRGRNREKVYYIQQGTELYEQLKEIVEESQNQIVNGKKGKHVIKEHHRQGKQWLKDLQRRSNYYEIRHHGIDYQPWAIIKENVWGMLGKEEKNQLIKFLRKEHRKTKFKPLTIRGVN